MVPYDRKIEEHKYEDKIEGTRSHELLVDFVLYCNQHPEERFWQALRNWSGYSSVIVKTTHDLPQQEIYDTFSFEGKRHDSPTD